MPPLDTAPEAQPRGFATPRRIFLLASAAFASAVNIRIVDPVLVDIARDLGVSVGQAAAVLALFTLAYGVAQLLLGPVGDRHGKLRVIGLGCAGAGLATLGALAVGSLSGLGVVRLLAGACAGAAIPMSLAWIGDQVAYDQRQPVIAKFLSGQILGIVAGQAVGGLLSEALTWRGALAFVGLIHIAAGSMLLAEVVRTPGLHQPGHGALDPRRLAREIVALWRRPGVKLVIGAVALEGFAKFGAFAYVGAHLRSTFGASAGLVGALLATYAVGALAYVVLAPRLLRRLGQTGLASGGGTLMALGYLALAALPGLAWAPPVMAVLGLGFYMLHNTLQTLATQMAPEARGLAVSQFAFCLFLGQSLGIGLAGLVVDVVGARPVFVAAAVLLLATGFGMRAVLARAAAAR